MDRINVSLPPALRQWIDARIAEGRESGILPDSPAAIVDDIMAGRSGQTA